jgi:vacuolar-type H+-ATPase subunit E/Vma4
MGEHELRAALRREADDRIREGWAAAEREVATRRAQVTTDLDALRQTGEEQALAAALAARRAAAATIEQALRRCRLLAESTLAERLRSLAEQVLTELAEQERDPLWRASVAEIPAAEWRTLRVAPADLLRARRDFPRASVEADNALIGGLIAATAGERIVVDNSLAGRLERGWPELLPELMANLIREMTAHETTGAATAG